MESGSWAIYLAAYDGLTLGGIVLIVFKISCYQEPDIQVRNVARKRNADSDQQHSRTRNLKSHAIY